MTLHENGQNLVVYFSISFITLQIDPMFFQDDLQICYKVVALNKTLILQPICIFVPNHIR